MRYSVSTISELEHHVGRKPAAADMKVIDHIDPVAARWLEAACIGFIGFSHAENMTLTIVDAGALHVTRDCLCFSAAAMDDRRLAKVGRQVGTLWLLPGTNETIRVNGVVASVDAGAVSIRVVECFAHCGKALIRSEFWSPSSRASDNAYTDPTIAVSRSRLMIIATSNASGAVDVSPKGDPAGLLAQFDGNTLRVAERPGNRRTDGFRNILEQPRVAFLLLEPGATRIIRGHGVARLTTHPTTLEGFAVEKKIPKLALEVSVDAIKIETSDALGVVAPWQLTPDPSVNGAAEVFAAHVKINRARNVSDRVAKVLVSMPGMMNAALRSDYKKNLY
ncbi:MAG: pyridoxamine 5'-phosphate oxidase family protein [Pseudomonadota bacterium]